VRRRRAAKHGACASLSSLFFGVLCPLSFVLCALPSAIWDLGPFCGTVGHEAQHVNTHLSPTSCPRTRTVPKKRKGTLPSSVSKALGDYIKVAIFVCRIIRKWQLPAFSLYQINPISRFRKQRMAYFRCCLPLASF
jgi:hypothetical protein